MFLYHIDVFVLLLLLLVTFMNPPAKILADTTESKEITTDSQTNEDLKASEIYPSIASKPASASVSTTAPVLVISTTTDSPSSIDSSATKTTTEPPVIGIHNLKYVCSYTLKLTTKPEQNGTQEVLKNKLILVPVCCPGYKKNDRGICMPHCEGGCGEGVCKHPGVCHCELRTRYCNFGNHTKPRPSQLRRSSCMDSCKNGVCLSNGTCQCNSGFRRIDDWTRLYTNTTSECVPFCFPFCTNRLFSDPEHCQCDFTSSEEEDDIDLGDISFSAGGKNSRKKLKKLFKKYGHPKFGTGAALGAAAGFAIASRNKPSSGQSHFGMGNHNNIPVGGSHGWNMMGGSGSATHGGSSNGNIGWNVPGMSNNFATTARSSSNIHPFWVMPVRSGTGIGTNTHTGWVMPGSSSSNHWALGNSGTSSRSNTHTGWVMPASSSSNNWASGNSGTSLGSNTHTGWVVPASSSSNNWASGNSGTSLGSNTHTGWVAPASSSSNNWASGNSGTSLGSNTHSGWVVPASSSANWASGTSGFNRSPSSSSNGLSSSSSSGTFGRGNSGRGSGSFGRGGGGGRRG